MDTIIIIINLFTTIPENIETNPYSKKIKIITIIFFKKNVIFETLYLPPPSANRPKQNINVTRQMRGGSGANLNHRKRVCDTCVPRGVVQDGMRGNIK
jgi:hypothetical protein